jgi:protein-L-isoaspartate O-methyltransferase
MYRVRYESVAAETVHGWLVDLLPNAPALVLDIGAGTGRDAAWLASRGLEVVAVEPSSNHNCCRRPWPRTRNANKRSKVSVGTAHISMAAIASA